VSCSNEPLKSRVNSVVQLAITTISSLTEAYGLNDPSRSSKLNQDIAEARFVDEDMAKEEEEDVDVDVEEEEEEEKEEEDMKIET